MTINNYENFDKHLKNLGKDIYAQPPDAGHAGWAIAALTSHMPEDAKTVLDLGCGQGFMKPVFEKLGAIWEGVTLGADIDVCRANNIPVHEADVSFLPFADNSYDLLYARHVLEHTACPLPTLMEWRRVSKKYLILIAPAPEYWGYRGKNHYSVAPMAQLKWWLERAGWNFIAEEIFTNRHTLFLNQWRKDLMKEGHLKAENKDRHFPATSQDVEYRFLCEIGKEVLV